MSKNLNLADLGPKRVVQMLLGVGGLVLLVGMVVMFLMNSQIRDVQATVSGKEALVGTSEQTAQRYQKTQQDYDAITSRAHYLEASVSAKAFVPTLLKQLQTLATATDLTVTAVRPGQITSPAPPAPAAAPGGSADAAAAPPAAKAPPPPYDTLDIGVDVVGTYAQTEAFLYDLTRFPKIISVASVQMHPGAAATPAPGTAQSSAPQITTNLHLTAFVFHDAATPAGGVAAPTTVALASPTTLTGVPPTPTVASAPGAPRPAPTGIVSAGVVSAGVVSDTATHAASRATGIGRAAQARTEVGIETL